MKSSTRLDSAIFQLTPTRTRYDLIITANGKTEKIASGLLNPFLAHLKTAQDQIAKGGYSILLQPEPGSGATWFTKGTVEMFVRFVSTPEILERVYTIESEILQIEEAISIQGNSHMGLSTVEDCQAKPVGSSEGSKPMTDGNEEQAIVLYKSDVHPPEANGSIAQEGNSKQVETKSGCNQGQTVSITTILYWANPLHKMGFLLLRGILVLEDWERVLLRVRGQMICFVMTFLESHMLEFVKQ